MGLIVAALFLQYLLPLLIWWDSLLLKNLTFLNICQLHSAVLLCITHFFSGKFYSHIYIIQKLEIKKPALHELYHASTEQSEFSIQTKYCVDDVLRLWIFTRSSLSLSLWNQMSVPINMLLNIAKRKIPL